MRALCGGTLVVPSSSTSFRTAPVAIGSHNYLGNSIVYCPAPEICR